MRIRNSLLDLTGGTRQEDSLLHRTHGGAQEIIETHRPAVPEQVVEAVRQFIREEEAKTGI